MRVALMAIRSLLRAMVLTFYPLFAGEGCGGGKSCGTIRAADYDQSCAVDTDCVLESEGDNCSAQCSCGNVAINVKDQVRYAADLAAATNPAPVECQCRAGAGACENGKCSVTAIGRPSDGGGD
jgi:hypothetical protein